MTLEAYEEVVEAEIVPDEITALEARALTDGIRVDLESVWQLVVEAYTRGAHSALGYASWDSYCKAEFGANRLRLPLEEKNETIQSLANSGLSHRAIASAVGTGKRQVGEALRQVGSENPPTQTLGQDGKTYTREAKPEPTVSERDWPEIPEPAYSAENRDTGLANGLRNDSLMVATRYIDFINGIAKNLPGENLAPEANAYVAQALRDNLAEIAEATEKAIAKIEGEGK